MKFLRHFWELIYWDARSRRDSFCNFRRSGDFGIIFELLLLFAVDGFWQEHKACRSNH